MKVLRALAATLLASTLVYMPAIAQMPDASHHADTQMTAASRHLLIDKLIEKVDQLYVFPDTAKKVAASLRAQHKRGAYDKITSAQRLAQVLSQEMQAAGGDRHLHVKYSENFISMRQTKAAPSPEETARRLAMLRSDNFGVENITHLPFNIGYLELGGFTPAQEAAETLAAAMTVVAHTDALIIDLRNNFGGDAAASILLASYLLDKRTHLSDFYYRAGNRTEQRWSLDVVPGQRYGQKKDVYILTSRDTFSAAEDFTYALKNLERATVIGETTGGGANGGEDILLLPNFAAFIPLSRTISPITKSNWERIGVTPHVSVCAHDALRTAQLMILQKWAESETNPSRLNHLKGRITELGSGSSAPCPGCACLQMAFPEQHR